MHLTRTLALASLVLAGFSSAPLTASAETATQTFAWPQGQRAAISLAYDDALDSQLDSAIPALDKHGLKATFYLQLSSAAVARRLPEWRAAAANGHELGNHTLFHQCSKSKPDRDWVAAHRNLDGLTVAQMKDQVVMANTMLFAIDGKRERTFTVPCGDREAAGQDYVHAIESEFVAIKSRTGDVIEDMDTLDPHAVPVAVPVGVTGQQLIAIAKEAARKGTMANFTFHGVGGDHLSVSVEAHGQLLEYLAANPDTYWVDTFLNQMKYVRAQQGNPPE